MLNKLVAAAATDAAAESEGAWFEYVAADQTFRVKLARAGTGNAAFMTLQNKLLKPWRAGSRNGQPADIPHEADREIQRKLFSQTIVKDWNADDFGTVFSVEMCHSTFKAANDFLDWVILTSQGQENFRKQAIEEAEGN